jgi:hypothetical protein
LGRELSFNGIEAIVDYSLQWSQKEPFSQYISGEIPVDDLIPRGSGFRSVACFIFVHSYLK